MKNFTNNFKQFTSRLSARWLIMALMMLVGTSSAWGKTYIAGSFNGWSTNNEEYELKNNTLTIILGKGNYEYKRVIDGSWENGGNRSLKINDSDYYLVTFNNDGTNVASKQFSQAAGTFYYDATNTPGVINNGTCYFMIGKNDHVSRTTLNRVAGTQYLFKGSVSKYDGALGWYVFYQNTGYTVNINKWAHSGDNTSTHTYTSAFTSNKIYSGKSSSSNATAEKKSPKRYEWNSSQTTHTTYKVTINSVEGGTLTVKDFDNATVSNGTSKSILTVLKFSATPSDGYDFTEVQIDNGSTTTTISKADLTTKTYTLTSNVTITPVWESVCVQSATAGTGLFSNGTITLSAKFNTCGNAYIGFQWKKQDDIDWCYTNDGKETCYKALGQKNISNAVAETSFTTLNGQTLSGTYVFRPYIVVGNDAKNWLYGEAFTVSTCVSVVEPAVTMSPVNGEVCQGYPITLTLTPRQSGVVYKIGEDEIFESTTTYSFIPNTSSVTVTASSTNACAGTNNKTKTFSISIKSLPEAPVFESNSMTVCAGEPFTLPTPTNLKVGTEDCIWSVGGKTTTGSQPGISQTTVYTAVKNDGCPSPSEEFTVNVTPKPTITASKTSCAPYEEIMLTSAAGAGTTWSTDGGILSATSGESVTFKAAPDTDPYTITASANGCTDTETITVACAEEDCSSKSVEFEIWLKVTGTIPTCHVWMDGTTDLGITSWPGNAHSTTKTEGGQTYYIWKFNRPVGNSYKDIGVIFSYNDGKDGKTGDIIVTDALGKKHVFAYNSSDASKTTKPEKSEALYSPTVTTVSVEQKEGEAAVEIKGFLQATGCADITKYGYQYRVSGNGDYTDVQVEGSKNICEEWTAELTDLEFGETYDFRAKATNEGGGKGYGEVIQVTIQGKSTPVVIKAVRNDRTVNESHWADFVALYVQEDGITAAAAKEVKNYTWEYSTDGTNWSTNFTGYVLGGASATVGVTNGSEKCNNIRPTKTGKYRVKVTYDNAKEQYSNIITITNDGFKLKYAELGQQKGAELTFDAASRTIPVFVVKTTEDFPGCPAFGMPSQDVEGQKAKKSVDVKIFENGNVVYDRKARMNYRGSSSLNFRKKSYAFCTGKEKTKNSKGDVDTGKENLFGLSNGAKDKDWVLYAAMPDPSMMRNRLIFDTYAQMTGKWGVNSMFVELIIDDEYMGVYVLMDKITKNENRVDITAADGFILIFDKTDVTDRFEDENSKKRNTFTTKETGKSGIGSYGATFDQRFEIEYPEMEDMGTEKWVEFVNDNVKGKIEAFEKALKAGNYTEVRKLIDYESWADWFIISEFAKNVDAYRASCFFVYNGDKIEARPLWDQELSFNNTATTVGDGKGCSSTSGLLIQNSGVYSDDFPAPFWFTGGGASIEGGLLNDPCFVTMVKNRYKDHLNNALSNGQLTGKISAYQTELTAEAKTRETNTWRPSSGEITACTGGGTGYTNISESISIGTMTDWITNRPAKLTTALDALTGSSINISIEPSFVETYPWEPFTLTVDAPEGYEYEMEFTKEGADATGNMVIEKGGDIYTVKIKRPADTLGQVFETVPYLATATLKVADDGCGGMTTPEANVNIRLNDREEDCE